MAYQGETSEEGLGAVLYQQTDGALRVIACGSRTLTAERNYKLHSSKLEFLVLKWAITECFLFSFLLCTVTTVHRGMSLNQQNSTPLDIAGWQSWQIRFTFKHRSGSVNRNADFLSRQPKAFEEIMQEYTEECQQEVIKSIGKAL